MEDDEEEEKISSARRRKGWGVRTITQRSMIHSVNMSALTHCRCKYDGAVALAWTDFEDTRAGKDVPGLDYVDTVFELGAVVGAGAVDLEKGVDVEGVGCHY